ncbi:hypothetical protein IFR05_011115 [Cadophora sp. M221]|nr:hypothetical protein IFR05_011115 [Cadophora sp. M221]
MPSSDSTICNWINKLSPCESTSTTLSSGSDTVAKNQLSESSTLAGIVPVFQKEEDPEEQLGVKNAAAGNDEAAPVSVEASTPKKTEEPLLDSTPVVGKTGKVWQIASNAIWKQAYDKFQTEQKDLHEAYQQLLVSEPESTQGLDVKAQAVSLAESRQKRMEDRQWTFRAWGSSKPRKVRDAIEGILTTTKSASSLISVGMSFAPVYVSLPWSAISALILFLMRDLEQQKDALQGVQDITRIMHGYNIAESTYLQDSSHDMHERFSDAVLELYVSLLVYQTKVAQYFGAKTAANLAKNALLQGVTWKEESLTITTRDSEAQRNLSFLGPALVEDLFRSQKQNIELIWRGISSQRDRDDAVLTWLSPNTTFDGHVKVQKALGQHYVSSSQWIFGLKNFDIWLHSEDQIMFNEGGVGSGKSSVTFSIVEKLLRGTHGQLAFFYCSNTGVDEGSTSSIVKSLIRQCAKDGNGETLKVPAQEIYEDDRTNYPDRCELDVGKSFDLLRELVDLSQCTTIVVDGLDECEDVEVLLFHLRKLWDETSSKLRIFLSSRYGHLPTVTEHFFNASHIEISDRNSSDIEAYLRTEIPPARTGRRLRNAMTDEQASTLRSVLQSRARGMFIWVTLQVEVFLPRELRARPKTEEDVASKLSLLVSSTANTIDSLQQVYDQVYQIAVGPTDQPRRKSMVEAALRMVICSYRPLTLSELAHVSAIHEHGVSKDIKDQPELLLEVCSNLLAEDPAGFMRFSHLSVKEYLEHRTPSIGAVGTFSSEFCHRQAATSCLRLNNSLQSVTTPRELMSLTNDINLVGFPTYAKTYWPRHFLDAGEQADMAEVITYLEAQQGGLERLRTLGLTLDDTPGNLHVSNFRNIPDLDIKLRQAARSGMENEVETLIALGADVHSRDIYGNTILHEAADWSRRSITEVVLVNSGPHQRELISAANESGNTAYHRAMLWGNQSVIQIIVGHSPSLALNMNFMSPLDVARFEDKQVFDSDNARPMDAPINISNDIPFFASKVLVSGPQSHDYQSKPTPKASSSILFDAKNLCSYCDVASWFENLSRGICHPHRRTFGDLKDSAKSGCELCKLFAEEIFLKGYHFKDDDLPSSCVSIRLLLSAEEGSSSGPQDLLVVLVGENAKATFEFFTDRATVKNDHEPAPRPTPDVDVVERLTTKISGRPIAPSLGDESCFDLARTWISNCETSHELCRYNESVPLPERVLRIEGDLHSRSFRLRTCQPAGEHGRYVYLSHLWGSVTPPILTTGNLEEKLAGRCESLDLPSSWQDALYAIMQMGFRYVWIDSLCIIQDSAADYIKLLCCSNIYQTQHCVSL